MGLWRRAGAQALLLTAAALVAAGPVFVGLHHLSVGHYYCPDHHELTHLYAPPSPGGAPHEANGLEATGKAGSRAGATDHEHCGLQPFARHDVEPAPGDASIATPERLFETIPASASAPRPALAPLAVAPKQSPPLAALA